MIAHMSSDSAVAKALHNFVSKLGPASLLYVATKNTRIQILEMEAK